MTKLSTRNIHLMIFVVLMFFGSGCRKDTGNFISADNKVVTTLDKTVIPVALPTLPVSIFPYEIFKYALMKVNNNGDFAITQQGVIVQMNASFKSMSRDMGIGIILLLLVLISIYRSVGKALIMILVLPLLMVGATWGMILLHKPMALPGMLGILLLFGIIIKNTVLLIDFYQKYREGGETPFKSAVESVRIRFRPVMMTTFGTIAGMIPIALENGVGLERQSPLSDVAIGRLFPGTLLH